MTTFNLILLVSTILILFVLLMVFSTSNLNKLYIKYILFIYPFISIDLLPSLFSTTIFDFITFIFLVFFYKPKQVSINYGKEYYLLFIILLIVTIIGIFHAPNTTKETISAFMQLITTFIFAKVLIDECTLDDSFILSILSVFKLILFFSILFLCFQLLIGISFTFERNLNNNVFNGSNLRFPSFFQDPQKFAQFLSVSSLLLFFQTNNKSINFIINLILLTLSLFAMMYTGGRAGFGGWCIGLFLILLFGLNKYRIPVFIVFIILYYLGANYTESFPMFNRLNSINEDYEFRYSIWQDAIQIFKDNPSFGIGIGNYSNYVSIHNPDQVWSTEYYYSYFDHPESGYLKFLTEFGLIGFIAILLLILLPIYRGFKTFNVTHNYNILVLIAALVSWLVGFYTIYSFDDTRIRILIITVLCLLIAKSQWVNLNESNQ